MVRGVSAVGAGAVPAAPVGEAGGATVGRADVGGRSMSEAITRETARAELHRLAGTVREVDPGEAAARLLERIAEVQPELRDALVEVGALAIVRESRS